MDLLDKQFWPSKPPQQKIVQVANLPPRPRPFNSVVGWEQKPDGIALAHGPHSYFYLGEVEWAWSPANHRVDAYYISRSRAHWILWLYEKDLNWGKRSWVSIGYVSRKQAVRKEAAIHLLSDYWRTEKLNANLDHFHWISMDAYLSVSELRTIALMVWPEMAVRPELSEIEDWKLRESVLYKS